MCKLTLENCRVAARYQLFEVNCVFAVSSMCWWHCFVYCVLMQLKHIFKNPTRSSSFFWYMQANMLVTSNISAGDCCVIDKREWKHSLRRDYWKSIQWSGPWTYTYLNPIQLGQIVSLTTWEQCWKINASSTRLHASCVSLQRKTRVTSPLFVPSYCRVHLHVSF